MPPPPRRRLAGEIVFTVLLVAASVFLLWTAHGISGFSSLSSAGAYPLAATAVLVVTGLINLAATLRAPAAERAPGESTAAQFVRQVTPGIVVAFTAAITAYMLLLDRLGFLLASYLFLLGSMRLLGSKRWGLNLVVSALSLAVVYLVFHTVFTVVLPSGTWLQGVWK